MKRVENYEEIEKNINEYSKVIIIKNLKDNKKAHKKDNLKKNEKEINKKNKKH